KMNQDRIGRCKTNQTNPDEFDWPLVPVGCPLVPQIRGNAHKSAWIYTKGAIMNEYLWTQPIPPGWVPTTSGPQSGPAPLPGAFGSRCSVQSSERNIVRSGKKSV